jgi:histidinol-phosphate/aromatic aminotransferase/cobyric acid decarboxylase-like protein/choline kinase
MMPLTRDRHKTMLMVAGRPVLASILDAIRDAGVSEIVMVVGYRANELREFVAREHADLQVTWVENHRYRETNNICSLALALEHTHGNDALVIESDLVFHPHVITRLLENPHPDVALLAPYSPGMDGTVVRCDPQHGLITDVFPPHLQPNNFDYSDKLKTLNIYKFSRQFCDDTLRRLVQFYARAFDEQCYYEVILGVLIYLQRAQIHGEVIDPQNSELAWAEVDDPVDLDIADFQMDNRRRRDVLDQAHGGFWKYPVLDFHFLRNVHFPPKSMLADLRFHLPDLLFNYGSSQARLDCKMSHLFDCPAEEIVTLNGCAQAFPWLANWLNGRRTLIPTPTFGEYSRLLANAATYQDDGQLDWLHLARRVRQEQPDAVVLVNPNNPTGTTLDSRAILSLVRECPATRFIVDESFLEFSEQPSLLRLVQDASLPPANLLVLKSLSKVWGVPGLRLGWAYSPDRRSIEDLRCSLPIWNVNSVAEYFLEMMFKHRDALAASFVQSQRDRDDFAQQLSSIDGIVETLVGGGNFVVLRCDPRITADELLNHLLDVHGIYVKDVTNRWSDGAVRCRVAVRDTADNRRFVVALRKVLATAAG